MGDMSVANIFEEEEEEEEDDEGVDTGCWEPGRGILGGM